MTVVSSKEFAANQRRFYDLALNERIAIKRGKNLFYLVNADTCNTTADDDDDEYVSKEEFLQESYKILDNFFANK